jgi:transcriptional regulator with XRE-family HTH domain
MLARLAGVSGEAARKWLSGESIPAMSHVSVLAAHFSVRADWLLTGAGPKQVDEVDALTDEERAHIERLRRLPPSERARVFRVLDAVMPPAVHDDDAA